MRSSQFLDRASQVILAIIFLSILIFLAWASHRGLDITDEGLYLLAARYPHDVLVSVTSAHYFTNLLFQIVGFDVSAFRTASSILLMFSGAGAGWATYQVIHRMVSKKHSMGDALAFASFGGVGASVYYVWGILSPGYNAVISVIVNLSLMTLSWLVLEKDAKEERHWKASLLALFQGILLGIAILTKFTAGFLLCFIFILWFVATARELRFKLLRLACLAGGILLLLVIFFVFLESPAIWYERYIKNTFQAVMITGHLPGYLIIKYGYDFLFSSTYMLFNSSFIFLFLIIILFYTLKGKLAYLLARIEFPVLVFLLCMFLGLREYCLGGYKHLSEVYQYYLFLSLSVFTLFCLRGPLALKRENKINYSQECIYRLDIQQRFYLVTLFILPFIAAAGTANPIVFNALMALCPWFCGYLLLFALLGEVLWSRVWTGAIVVLISLLVACQVFSAVAIFPYSQVTNLFNSIYIQELGDPPSRLYLDKHSQQFISQSKGVLAANGFKKGDPILAFTDMAGLVFAWGGRSPGTPWWAGKWGVLSNNRKYNEFILSLVPNEALDKLILIQNMSDQTGMPDLKAKGIMFPNDFTIFARGFHAFRIEEFRFWKLRAGIMKK